MTNLSDAELLQSYAQNGSNAAFERLVGRHVDAVYSIALRQVGGDAHLAKDVTQIVFATVARKAASLSSREVLGGWLCRTTQYAARDVVRTERRRRLREEQACAMESANKDPDTAQNLPELRRRLDDAMAGLGEADRSAVWLRFFEKNSFSQIGVRLRLTENAARMRVDRALDRMRLRLARRGITSTALALGELLADRAAGSVPTDLASTISSGVFACETGTATFGLIHLMTSTKLAVVASGALAVAGAIGALSEHRINSELRAQAAALRNQLSTAEVSQTRNRQLAQALRESDKELGDLLDAVARMRPASTTQSTQPALSGPRLTIIGAVERPGPVPVTGDQGVALTNALSSAGGLALKADRRVVVNHRDADGTIDKRTIDLREIASGKIDEPRLQANDIVVVFERTR